MLPPFLTSITSFSFVSWFVVLYELNLCGIIFTFCQQLFGQESCVVELEERNSKQKRKSTLSSLAYNQMLNRKKKTRSVTFKYLFIWVWHWHLDYDSLRGIGCSSCLDKVGEISISLQSCNDSSTFIFVFIRQRGLVSYQK